MEAQSVGEGRWGKRHNKIFSAWTTRNNVYTHTGFKTHRLNKNDNFTYTLFIYIYTWKTKNTTHHSNGKF